VLSVPQILREEQVVGRKFVETLNAEVGGGQPMKVTRPGFRLGDDYPVPGPPPQLGQDTERWLAELGYGMEEMTRLKEAGTVTSSNKPTVPDAARLPDLKARAETSSS
jgi:crotonobetainyl-CoA:carnitine CoA-transferase CaiB-like acyl-CoA transferase